MHESDAFELKDTVSVHSMDSAYQSQSGASRRGTTMPEGFQTMPAHDSRSRTGTQFVGSDIYSPSLGSDNFVPFPEAQDMNQMHLPPPAADIEAGDGAFAYANYSTGQDFSQYSTTNVTRFAPASPIDMEFPWGAADAQTLSSTFSFQSYPKSSQSIDAALYSSQEPVEMMFGAPASTQRQMSRPRLDTSGRPATVRSPSSFSASHDSRRASVNDASFGAFVMSPTSAVNVQLPQVAEFGPQQLVESRNEKEETASTSLATQSIHDDDETLSPSDAAEAKTMEEEQGKVARSHPLYQAQPEKDGKYHCPNERDCNHKPTPLKCNYDKYVDSHLKPFRCQKKMCVGVQFSSTACLLRHEREAHGMHGHGSRPHLCHFADCERSVPGNGFPRRYNLFDHMKRVHDYTGPTTTELSPTATQGHAPGNRKAGSRKRKSTAEEESSAKRQKATKPSPQQQLLLRRAQLEQEFSRKRQNIIDILTKLTGPNDLRDDIQLTKEVVHLHEISTKYKENLGG